MRKVTNHHKTPLAIAGVEIGPGRTVGIEEDKLKVAMRGNAAKVWFKLGLLSVEGSDDDDDNEGESGGADEREALLDRAKELGLNPSANVRLDRLRRMVEKAEKEAAEPDEE